VAGEKSLASFFLAGVSEWKTRHPFSAVIFLLAKKFAGIEFFISQGLKFYLRAVIKSLSKCA